MCHNSCPLKISISKIDNPLGNAPPKVNTQRCLFTTLPFELVEPIFLQLGVCSSVALGLTCGYFYNVHLRTCRRFESERTEPTNPWWRGVIPQDPKNLLSKDEDFNDKPLYELLGDWMGGGYRFYPVNCRFVLCDEGMGKGMVIYCKTKKAWILKKEAEETYIECAVEFCNCKQLVSAYWSDELTLGWNPNRGRDRVL